MWIILEGLDRTGKSSVAELYRAQGFEIKHMSAPDKKYKKPGYTGPSYLDDMLELYMELDGKDVLFDRSIYGEFIWPYIYNREPMLTEDDLEILQEFEDRNQVQRFLMVDPDTDAHWQRCVANKEPLTFAQFKTAGALFNKLAHKYNFIPRQLSEFKTETKKQDSAPSKQEAVVKAGNVKASDNVTPISRTPEAKTQESELDKLEKANAIRDVLSKRILKQKGGAFDKLEDDLKTFLKTKLTDIFSDQASKVSLSEEEITILKIYCKQLKEKVGKK